MVQWSMASYLKWFYIFRCSSNSGSDRFWCVRWPTFKDTPHLSFCQRMSGIVFILFMSIDKVFMTMILFSRSVLIQISASSTICSWCNGSSPSFPTVKLQLRYKYKKKSWRQTDTTAPQWQVLRLTNMSRLLKEERIHLIVSVDITQKCKYLSYSKLSICVSTAKSRGVVINLLSARTLKCTLRTEFININLSSLSLHQKQTKFEPHLNKEWTTS